MQKIFPEVEKGETVEKNRLSGKFMWTSMRATAKISRCWKEKSRVYETFKGNSTGWRS